MPVPDPNDGYAFVWFISSMLFLSIAIGGACLVMYMILPESQSTSWLAIVGVTLVCLPWLFWFVTCFYRIISRTFGFRMVVGFGGGGGGGGGGHGGRAGGGGGGSSRGGGSTALSSRGGHNGTSSNGAGAGAVAAESSSVGNNNTRQAKFGGNGSDNNSSHGRREIKDGNKQSSSSNNSIASRESEIPLTSFMSS